MGYIEFFHKELKKKMDEFVHSVYDLTRHYPSHEIFGVTSQTRRASLSVVLNFIEGYARQKKNSYKYFLEISYASLKESEYLLEFARVEKYITDTGSYNKCQKLADEIGAMLWRTIEKTGER